MHESLLDVYNECQEAKQKWGKTKNYFLSQQEPNQSTKSIKDIVLPSMCIWIHKDRLLGKELFSLWTNVSSSSNTLQSLSF